MQELIKLVDLLVLQNLVSQVCLCCATDINTFIHKTDEHTNVNGFPGTTLIFSEMLKVRSRLITKNYMSINDQYTLYLCKV